MLRPAIYILIYTILGILSGIYITNALFIYVCVFLTFVITVSICICRKNLLYFMFFVPFLTAFAVGSVSGLYTDKNIDMLADTEYPVKINAIVNEKANTYDDTFKYNITASQLSYGESTIKQNINMFMYTDKELQIGDTVKFTSLLKHGNVKRNNADFNEIIYFKTKKIQYKTFPDSIVVTGHKNTLYGNIKKVSYMFQNTINKLYPQKEAGLMTAMLLGDRNDLDDETYKLYQNAGIVHIISVSGLHISILAGLVLFLLRPLGRYPSSLLTALFLIFYTILAGASPSVVRASLMMFLYILSGLISRKYDLLSSTSIICCVLLMYNPYYIFDLGFLYSFTSVFSIGFSSEIIKKYKIENKLLNILIVSTAVSLATKPITAHYFYYINCTDFILNIIVIALSDAILILGIISAIVGTVALNAGIFLSGSVYVLLKIIEYISEIFVALPFSHIQTGSISLLTICIWFGILILIYKAFMHKAYLIWTAPLLLSALVILNINKYSGFEAEFLYVGQGDCAVIKDENKCYIMDAGSSEYKSYGQVLLDDLKYENINKIDGIYISHMDYDHMGGVLEIADKIPIDNIYISKYSIHNENYDLLLTAAHNNNINIIYTDESYNEYITKNTFVEFIYSDKNADNLNNNSVVYKVSHNNKSILFTGDIDNTTADEIAKSCNVKADILKVPHHGSKDSFSYDFVKAVAPSAALNSAGHNNIYGHPSSETIEGYNNLNIPFFTTDYNGMIKIRICDDTIKYKLINTKFIEIKTLE